MTEAAFASANAQLADEARSREILDQSPDAVAALSAIGVSLNPVELAFMQALSWTALKGAILSAYDQGMGPELKPEAGSPGVEGPDADGVITLRGTLPVGGN